MKTKTMRTVAAALSALCLCTAAIAPTAVSAATITINDSVNVSVANRTFSAYKIFDVEVGTAGGESSYKYTIVNAWKSAITGYGAFGLSEGATNDQIVEKITALNAAADIQAFANYLKNQVAEKPEPVVVTAGANVSTVDITVPTAGYYLVLDTSNAENVEVISAVMLDTITNTTVSITLKADAPTLTKKIWEDQNHDGTVTAGELFDANTASIGDTVNYYLTSRVPDTQYYTSYTFKITDTFDAGLTYNGDVAITVGGETLAASAYTVEAIGQVLTITFNDMKTLGGTDAGDEIAVTYSATVNENAVIGTSGNENVANLIYSNDPSSESTKETAGDVVVTYLGEFQIYKTNNAATPAALAGAEFTLYSDSGCTVPIYLKATATDTYQVCASTTQGAVAAITTSDSGRLIIQGLKAGTYYIKETDAPDGYNPIRKVISMTLTATEDSVAITNTAISHAADETCTWSYAVACDDTNVSGATNVITVVNKSGSIFPNTGGIGTTIFTVGGLVLMIGAAGLFLIKRMKNSK